MTLRAKLSPDFYIVKSDIKLDLKNYIIFPEFVELLKRGKEGQRYIYNDYQDPKSKAIYRIYYPTKYEKLDVETPDYKKMRLHFERLTKEAKFSDKEIATVTDIPGVAHRNAHKLALQNYASTLDTTHAFLKSNVRMSGSCMKKRRYNLVFLSGENLEYEQDNDDLVVIPNEDGSLTYKIQEPEILTGIITKEELQKQLGINYDNFVAEIKDIEDDAEFYYLNIMAILEEKEIPVKKISHFLLYIARSTINFGDQSPIKLNRSVEWVLFYSMQNTLNAHTRDWPMGVDLGRNLPWFLIEPGAVATDNLLLNSEEISSPEYKLCTFLSKENCLSLKYLDTWVALLERSEDMIRQALSEGLTHTIYTAAGLMRKRSGTLVISDEDIVTETLKLAKELDLLINVDACSPYIPTKETLGATALMYALKRNKPRVVKILLAEGANIHAKDMHGYSAFDYAIIGNNEDLQDLLVAKGVNLMEEFSPDTIYINSTSEKSSIHVKEIIKKYKDTIFKIKNSKNLNLLHAAAFRQDYDTVKLCIKNKIAVDEKTIDKYTALHFALIHKGTHHIEAVKFLLEQKADPYIENNDGKTPLKLAFLNGIESIAKLFSPFLMKLTFGELLDLYKDKTLFHNAQSEVYVREAIFEKLKSISNPEFLFTFIEIGEIDTLFDLVLESKLDLKPPQFKLVLIAALKAENLKVIDLFSEKGIALEPKDLKNIRTTDTLKMILKKFPKCNNDDFINEVLKNAIQESNFTVFSYFLNNKRKNMHLLAYIIEKSDDPKMLNVFFTTKSSSAYTLFSPCAQEEKQFTVLLNQLMPSGISLLEHALEHKNFKMAQFLIILGSNVNILNTSSQTPLMIMINSKNNPEQITSFVKYLLKKGANPHIQDKQGNTALMYAIKKGLFYVVKEMLTEEKEADKPYKEFLSAKNPITNESSVDMALKSGNTAIIELILPHLEKETLESYIKDSILSLNPNIKDLLQQNYTNRLSSIKR